MEAYTSSAKPSYTEETQNLSMTAKQPPSYDGKVSWFRYEELVDDWVTITTVEAAKRMSTTVAELHGLMRCYGSALFLRGLWSDITGEIADVHIRTDANNLVTTASTTHQPDRKKQCI